VLAAAPKDAAPNVEVAPPKAGVEAAPKAGADAAPNAGVEAGTGLAPKAGAELPPNPPKLGVEPPPKLKPPPLDAAPNAGVEGVLALNAPWDAAAPNPPACRSILKMSFLVYGGAENTVGPRDCHEHTSSNKPSQWARLIGNERSPIAFTKGTTRRCSKRWR